MIDPEKLEGLITAQEEKEKYEKLKSDLGPNPNLQTLKNALNEWVVTTSYRWLTAVEFRFIFQHLIPMYMNEVAALESKAEWVLEYAVEDCCIPKQHLDDLQEIIK